MFTVKFNVDNMLHVFIISVRSFNVCNVFCMPTISCVCTYKLYIADIFKTLVIINIT